MVIAAGLIVLAVGAYMFMGDGLSAASATPPPAPGSIAAAVASVTGAQGTSIQFREKQAPVNPDGSKVTSYMREANDNEMPLTSLSGGAKSVPQQRKRLAPLNVQNEMVGNTKRLVGNVAAVPKSVAGVDTVADAQNAFLVANSLNQALIVDLGQAHEARSNARHFGLKAGSDNAWHLLMQQNGLEQDPADIVRKKGCSGFNSEMAMRLPSHHPCFQEMLNTVQADQPSRIRA